MYDSTVTSVWLLMTFSAYWRALLLELYWLLRVTQEIKMDILSNGPHLVSLQWAEKVTRSQTEVTVESFIILLVCPFTFEQDGRTNISVFELLTDRVIKLTWPGRWCVSLASCWPPPGLSSRGWTGETRRTGRVGWCAAPGGHMVYGIKY